MLAMLLSPAQPGGAVPARLWRSAPV